MGKHRIYILDPSLTQGRIKNLKSYTHDINILHYDLCSIKRLKKRATTNEYPYYCR